MDLSLVPYQHTSPSLPHHHDHDHPRSQHPIIIRPNPDNYLVKYKECMRNHAASIGRHASDGCGEFMPRGDDGTREFLTCAACGCHRNFHRREGGASSSLQHYDHHYQVFSYNAASGKKHLMSSYFDDGTDIDDHDRRSETPEREEVNAASGGRSGAAAAAAGMKSKRFRTKFTQEQKEMMLGFAEKIGWRINKNDDVALNNFCNEVGVKRSVLKVWMHNNKSAHRRKEAAPPVSPVAAPPPPPPPDQPPAPPQPGGV